MPNFLKTPEDERLWDKAKAVAAEEGHKEDWPYITGIWKKMKGKTAMILRVASLYHRASQSEGVQEFLQAFRTSPAWRKWWIAWIQMKARDPKFRNYHNMYRGDLTDEMTPMVKTYRADDSTWRGFWRAVGDYGPSLDSAAYQELRALYEGLDAKGQNALYQGLRGAFADLLTPRQVYNVYAGISSSFEDDDEVALARTTRDILDRERHHP